MKRMSKMLCGIAGALALVAGLATSPVIAGPIVVDGGWVGFCFNDGGPATVGCQNQGTQTSGNDFTFTALANVVLQVTDAFTVGDFFAVYDFGVLLFNTGPISGNPNSLSNPDLAFASPDYSHGAIVLAAGNHQISVFNTVGCCGRGGAYLQVTVPEPGTLALIAASLTGLALTRRRKQR